MANNTGKKFGGRSKNTPNRTSEAVRQSLLKLLDDNLDQLKKDLKEMKAKDRAIILINLAKHCTAPAMNLEKLTEDQLLQIIQYIKENENKT
jgi:hypothetical protein